MKYIPKLFIVICITLVLFGCTATTINEPDALTKYSDFIWLTRVVVNLASLHEADNVEGFNDISQKYGVNITDPFQNWFTSSADLVQALRELREAMKADSSRDLSPEMEELVRILEMLPEN